MKNILFHFSISRLGTVRSLKNVNGTFMKTKFILLRIFKSSKLKDYLELLPFLTIKIISF
jgi:hypothetical protein